MRPVLDTSTGTPEIASIVIEPLPPSAETPETAPTWIREAAARFLLLGARLIRGRKMNAARHAQAEFYEHLAEIARKGEVSPYKPAPRRLTPSLHLR